MKTGLKILVIILGTVAFGALLIFSLPLAQKLFHLTYYCVPEKVFPEETGVMLDIYLIDIDLENCPIDSSQN